MKIGIIGTGNVGSAVGKRWAAAGHEVMFGTRDPGDARVRELVAAAGGKTRVGTIGAAATFGDVVLLATPFAATESAIRQAGHLTGKVVIDATNPLTDDFTGLTLGHSTSAAEMVAGWAPGARVIKALNTTGAGNMTDPRYGSETATMFLCGDDSVAKAVVTDLVKALGFEVVDAGPLRSARLLEPMAMLWITLAYGLGHGPNIAFRLLRR
jgi:predicted dinucleotide-binding enzyme